MDSVPIRMLWERDDPLAALQRRFQFSSAATAAAWVTTALQAIYAIEITSVDALVISAYNLLAWLSTAEQPLLAKCCMAIPLHERLVHIADLLAWLQAEGMPVSAPLTSTSGARQTIYAHCSLGVQHLLPGTLLNPSDSAQSTAAGTALAALHSALVRYPHAQALGAQPVQPLPAIIAADLEQLQRDLNDPTLEPISARIRQQLPRLAHAQLPVQLIHGDYRSANLLWRDDHIQAVLDFEEVRGGYRVSDLAWAAVHLATQFHDWGPLDATAQAAFLHSYSAHAPLSAVEQAWLPTLMAWHSLALLRAASHGQQACASRAALQQHVEHLPELND